MNGGELIFVFLLAGWALVGLLFYGWLARDWWRGRGKVSCQGFGPPDFILVSLLCAGMAWLILQYVAPGRSALALTVSLLLGSALQMGVLVVGILVFLSLRGVSLGEAFGFRVGTWKRAVWSGGALLIPAFPVVLAVNFLASQWLGGEEAQQQEVVRFFAQASSHSQWMQMAVAAGTAVLVAPLAEEFVFRGYIYGTLRRRFGALPALLVSAGFFAAVHGNALAAPSLFVLAVFLTLAYETVGSLVVPMVMHALFNAVMLGLIYAQGGALPS